MKPLIPTFAPAGINAAAASAGTTLRRSSALATRILPIGSPALVGSVVQPPTAARATRRREGKNRIPPPKRQEAIEAEATEAARARHEEQPG
ncbi:hypothetical protein GCM10010472_23420 [Pseudonocardia halophobica]|uniref:Uncharacterized protein n=1 Tax=Pseudonocardia halophobica TaxID=29401 RepID=A0A9W6L003_9PSEU|nr:hypothetical protein GCM10017577_07150 [Pseudonocardia halophobica]